MALLTLALAVTSLAPASRTLAAPAPTVVRVTDFGADPGGHRDSAAAVAAALRHAKELDRPVRVVFPRGTYSIYPEQAEKRELYLSNTVGADPRYRDKRIGILVEDMENVTVDGDGSTLLYHGGQTAFASLRSKNVVFQNFAFDYVNPHTIEATVAKTGVEDGHAYRVLSVPRDTLYSIVGNEVHWRGEASPTTGEPYWTGVNGIRYTQVYDPAEQTSHRTGNPLFSGVTGMRDLGDGRIRIDYATTTAPGDQGLVYTMDDDIRDTAAAFFWESTDVTVRDLDARYLHGFGFLGQLSRDITIENTKFASDKSAGRYNAGDADLVQMSGVAGRVVLRNNVFDGAHDDPINIHGTYLGISARPDDARTLELAYRQYQSVGFPAFYPGDEIEIVSGSSMTPVPGITAKVVSVDGPSGKDHDKPLSTMTITLDQEIPAQVTAGDHYVENTTYTPEVLIEGNEFRNIPTRGILVTTRRPVVIRDNLFARMNMASIFISSDTTYWWESGPVNDVLIEHNTFYRPTSPVIFVEPTNPVIDPQQPVHRNIRVVNNDFVVDDVRLADIKSVSGFTFSGNQVRRYDRDQALAVQVRDRCPAPGDTVAARVVPVVPEHTTPAFRLRGGSDVTIADNTYDPGINQRVDLERTDPAEVSISGEATRIGQDTTTNWPTLANYSSSRPSVLEVGRDGTVRAKKPGTAVLSANVRVDGKPLKARPVTVTVGGDPSSADCAQEPELSRDWTVLRDVPANRSLDEDGTLTLTPSPGFLFDGFSNARNVLLTTAGDGTGTATVRMTGRTQDGWAEAGLLLYRTDDDYVAIQRKYNNDSPTVTVVTEFGGRAEESRRIADPVQDDIWLRLTRSGDQVTASYSLDGRTFSQIGSPVDAGALGTARYGVMAQVPPAGADHPPFRFDGFLAGDTEVPFVARW
ncbi:MULTISPECIES: beta-xylosidase family glycoside hydrolase [unclassified Isoptericola]|uniref:beta-xylosidase family glycoside hydrolase n=1 Tax=unclassified Isoptericola TaxID=2623355 RepID=UPI0036472341